MSSDTCLGLAIGALVFSWCIAIGLFPKEQQAKRVACTTDSPEQMQNARAQYAPWSLCAYLAHFVCSCECTASSHSSVPPTSANAAVMHAAVCHVVHTGVPVVLIRMHAGSVLQCARARSVTCLLSMSMH